MLRDFYAIWWTPHGISGLATQKRFMHELRKAVRGWEIRVKSFSIRIYGEVVLPWCALMKLINYSIGNFDRSEVLVTRSSVSKMLSSALRFSDPTLTAPFTIISSLGSSICSHSIPMTAENLSVRNLIFVTETIVQMHIFANWKSLKIFFFFRICGVYKGKDFTVRQ